MRHFLSVLIFLFLLACPLLAQDDLEPVPRPAEGSVEASVAEQIEKAHDLVEEQVASGDDPRALAGAFSELGQLYAAYELWDGARAALANSVQLAPDAVEPLHVLGYVEAKRGEPGAAAARFEQVLDLEATSTAAWLRLGEARVATDDPSGAEVAFERARRLEESAAAHFGLGRVAARIGRYSEAVEHFERALALAPGANQIRVPLAQALRRLGRVDEARQHLEQRGEVEVGFADAFVEGVAARASGSGFYKFRGDQYVLAQRFQEAVAAYRSAVVADPSSFYARKSLGLTLYHVSMAGEAVQQLRAALQVSKDDVPATERAQVAFALGGIEANRGDLDAAAESFAQAAELDPGYAAAWLQLGNLHGRQQDWDEAIEDFTRALEVQPDLRDALVNRATARMDQGRFGEALPDLERALELAPQDPRASHLLEIARREAGGG